MSQAMKGTLLSALVFPGAGQLALRSYVRGFTLLAIVTVSLVLIIVGVMVEAEAVLAEVQSRGGVLDLTEITRLSEAAVSSSDHALVGYAGWAILVCWVVGIVDAWRTGRRLDREAQAAAR